MTLEIGGDAEGAIAFFAFVRLFARVSPQVPCQVGGTREVFPAIFARVSMTSDRAFSTGGGVVVVAVTEQK